MKKRYVLLLLIQFFSVLLFSQTGPGGVGSRNGSSSLIVWLRANDLNADGNISNNPTNGSLVSTWSDFSGNTNNFTQTGTNRPSYNSSGTFDAVNFNSSLAAAQFMSGSTAGIFPNASTFIAINPVNTGNSHTLLDHSSASLRVEQWFNTNRVGLTRYGVSDYSTSITSPFNINSIISYHKPTGSSIVEVRVNGATQNLNIGSTTAGIPLDRIGRNSNGADEASGDFFEIIFFNSRVNDAQKIIIDNYLSAKFGNINIPINVYDEDNAGAGNYDHEVAGIGRVDASNLHNDSQGTGIVRISNPTNLGNNEFFMWGHDNGALQMNTGLNAPSVIKNRLTRTWRVSETNTSGGAIDVGSIDMRFDLTGITGVSSGNLRLLVDTDNDGNFNDETPISGSVSLGSNIYSFNGISSISNNRRFTIGLAFTTIITNRRITHRVNN
ncbi:hypothetical protein SAMN04489761_1585 [Tenacibaculum sp. MAR_2009_124]|uniref:hypothetical protein n=1 Tax=Tenacibaculum sp. MAR_2009_124 TaxID=1250059 RepID=UPI00089B7743|nr:hypothetical protein [Tenacibaculum sp. MAR_2009_124]SEB72851.1 hypothetical protein SAMN04489761_1585 [Tenacibaculum sp. MAR_2009_124]